MKKQIQYIIDFEIDYDDDKDWIAKIRFIRSHIKLLMKTYKHFNILKIKINE